VEAYSASSRWTGCSTPPSPTALREPGQWVLASENEIVTEDLGLPADYRFDAWTHWAISFETAEAEGLNRKMAVKFYKDGLPVADRVYTVPVTRLARPNQTRIVLGIRSSAHAVPTANSWPPSTSGLDPSLREASVPSLGQWPAPNDAVKHGASHSPFFEGSLRRVSLIKNALSPEEVRGLYLGLELGCHCFDACPTGANLHFPGVQVPCSGQGVCRRYNDGLALGAGFCDCMPGYHGANCERHCADAPSEGCCEEDDDCPPGTTCNRATKACLA